MPTQKKYIQVPVNPSQQNVINRIKASRGLSAPEAIQACIDQIDFLLDLDSDGKTLLAKNFGGQITPIQSLSGAMRPFVAGAASSHA